MSKPAYRVGVAACNKFASPVLRQACLAHRAPYLMSHLLELHKTSCPSKRNFATAVSNSPPSSGQGYDNEGVLKSLRSPQQDLIPTSRSVNESISQLDPYLPLEGRSGTWLENLAAFEGVRNAKSLPSVLREIDSNFKHGALTSLALDQQRWPAYVFLTKALIKAYADFSRESSQQDQDVSVWDKVELPPAQILTSAGKAELYPKILPLTTSKTIHPVSPLLSAANKNETVVPRVYQYAMSAIWQSLGLIILEASKRDRIESEKFMNHVHQVLSFLHSEDVMHPKIYHFDSNQVPEIYRKSPFLHSMSSRIMTVISDSTWKAVEGQVIDSYTWMSTAYAKAEGLELKDLYPTVRFIGHETWLDLVLWSCVLGGHSEAGLDIINEMASGYETRQWHGITWSALLEDNARTSDAGNARKLRSRFDKVAGAFEGYSSDPPILTLPPQNVSSEVIVALIKSKSATIDKALPDEAVFDAGSFKNLLDQSGVVLSNEFWNMVTIRAVEAARFNDDEKIGVLQSLIQNTERETTITIRGRTSCENWQSFDSFKGRDSQSLGSLYHVAFSTFIDLGDINGALKAFVRLQRWIDDKKKSSLSSFFSTPWSLLEGRTQNRTLSDIKRVQELYSSPIPAATMAAFFDLITNYRLFDLGSWLLTSKDPDGPFITASLRTSGVFIPALVRFASAVRDYSIIQEVVKGIERSRIVVTSELLHALFHAYIEFERFQQVGSILKLLRNEKLESVSTLDIMVLAQKILHLEQRALRGSDVQITAASRLLSDILSFRYVKVSSGNQHKIVGQYKEISQVHRVLSSINGILSETKTKQTRLSKYGSTTIPTEAFNVLLKGLVDTQGPLAGKILVEKWCIFFNQQTRVQQLDNHEDVPVLIEPSVAGQHELDLPAVADSQNESSDQVVRPDKYTIQIIMDSALSRKESKGFVPDESSTHTSSRPPMLKWETDWNSALNADPETEAILVWCQSIMDGFDK